MAAEKNLFRVIAGRTVTRQGREQYPVTMATVPGGAAVLFSRGQRSLIAIASGVDPTLLAKL
jgi:hypothetical protein